MVPWASGRPGDIDALTLTRPTMPADEDVADLADVFGLLADPGRLRLMAALLGGERCVGDLAAAAGLSESAASHALRILRAHRVVSVRRAGRMAFYALADAHVRTLLDVALAHVAHSPMVHDHPEGTGHAERPADRRGHGQEVGRSDPSRRSDPSQRSDPSRRGDPSRSSGLSQSGG